VTFDEYIQLDNVMANLLISPPMQHTPEVKARGKRLLIHFADTLLPNTTYTLDFGNAVCDFREKVPLAGFSYCFSTGDEIDTLAYTGHVYDASTLNPMQGILVGIHRDTSDTAFTQLPFLRISKTDTTGFFRIGNIHEGTYRLYAVDDIGRDYRLTPGEALAFASEHISIPADSAATGQLLLFREEQQKLYLQKVLREKQHCIQLLFSATPDSLPQWQALGDSLNAYTHFSSRHDTVTLWLKDSMSIRQDSLKLVVRYRYTDSLFHMAWNTDTLRAFWRAPRLNSKMQEHQERLRRNRKLDLKTNARKDFELNDTLRLTSATPLVAIDLQALHLYLYKDSAYTAVPFTLAPHDSVCMALSFIADLKPGQTYELRLDSAALQDLYGTTHPAAKFSLTLKQLEDYSTLRVKLNPYLPSARIQLLDKKDNILRELPADEAGAFFQYLKPDTYYMRLYIDENNDGQWTTGSWAEHRQPEPIYYFPGNIQTKSNWDFEEEWNYLAAPQFEAKPKELIPAAKKK